MRSNSWGSRSVWAAVVLLVAAAAVSEPQAQTPVFRRQVTMSDATAFAPGSQDIRFDDTAKELGSAIVFGDFDGDGFKDVAIGERRQNRVFLYFGRLSLDPNQSSLGGANAFTVDPNNLGPTGGATLTCSGCLTDPNNNSDFGFSLAKGDVNDDGRDDLIIGAPFDDDGGRDKGRAFVVLGRSRAGWGTSLNVDADGNTVKIRANPANQNAVRGYFLGFAVASGDINADGFDDIVVTSRNANAPLYQASPANRDKNLGAVHIVAGTATLSGTIDLSNNTSARHIVGDKANDFFGESVALCHVDGVAGADLVVGAIGHDNDLNPNAASNSGAAYIFTGAQMAAIPLGAASALRTNPGGGSPPASTILGADKDDSLGFSATCADFNGDGFDDPALSAFFAGGLRNKKAGVGEVFVFSGQAAIPDATFPALRNLRVDTTPADGFPDQADEWIIGSTPGDQFGFALSAGNVNCNVDTVPDLVVSARRYDVTPNLNTTNVRTNAGATYVIRGSTTRPKQFQLDLGRGTFDPNRPNVRPGEYPLSASDAPSTACDPNDPDAPGNACAVVAVIFGASPHSQTGFSNAVGDFNNDSCDDIAIGAVGDLSRIPSYPGHAYIITLSDNDQDGTSDLSDQDDDNDCLPDVAEDLNQNGVVNPGETSPLMTDTDGDGIEDGTEKGASAAVFRGESLFIGADCSLISPSAPQCCLDKDLGATTTDPLDSDTDGDTLLDGAEDSDHNGEVKGDANHDGLVTGAEIVQERDPRKADTDGDGIDDNLESMGGCPSPIDADSDDDGIADGCINGSNGAPGGACNDPREGESLNGNAVVDPGETNFCLADTDGDGLQDGTEVGVAGAGVPGPNGQADTAAGQDGTAPAPIHVADADPLTTTNPLLADTDADCIPDGCIAGFNGGGACAPLPLAGPIVQGEDVNLNGRVDGIPGGTGTVPALGAETNPNQLDTDADSLPDGLEWGVPVGATCPVGKGDADPPTTTDPRDSDTDDGGVVDGFNGVNGEDLNLNGRWDFDTNTFLCGANQTLDLNNETNPGVRNDDRGATFSRTPSPVFPDPNGVVVTAYLQDDTIRVTLTDSDQNRDAATAETIVLNASNTVDPANPALTQGLSCVPDDPAGVGVADLENITLTETGPNTGVFQGSVPATAAAGALQDGTLNCIEDNRARFAYRDPDDLCDQRTSVADVTLAQIRAAVPATGTPPITTPVSTVRVLFSQDIQCGSVSTAGYTVVGTAGGALGTLACDSDPNQAQFGPRRATLSFAPPLPDDRYTVSLDCDAPAPTAADARGFAADCELGCVVPVGGNPAYCAGVISGNGTAGGLFTYPFVVDNDSSPTATALSPGSGQTVTAPPAEIEVQFSEAMDPATITALTFTVAGTSTAVTCASVTYDAVGRSAICTVGTPATLPDDRYTVTLSGTGGAPIRDLAGNALDGDGNGTAGADFVYSFVVDADSSPSVITAFPLPADVFNATKTAVTVDFTEAMDAATVTAANFTVVGTAGAVTPDSVTYNPALKRATFAFAAGFPDDRFTVLVKGTGPSPVKDLAGNALDGELILIFPTGDGTAGGDFTYSFIIDADQSPAMTATAPATSLAPGTITTTPTSTVTATFAEAMDGAGVSASTVSLVGTAGAVTPVSVTYDASLKRAIFTAASALPDDQYTFTVKGTGGAFVVDQNNNALDGEFAGTFPTGDGAAGGDFVGLFRVDTDSSPSASLFSPAAGQTLTVPPTDVTVQFTEAMDPATITTSSFTLAGTSVAVTCSSVTYDAANRRATCTIGAPATLPDDRYTVTLLAGTVRDLAGNALDGDGNGTVGDNFVSTFNVDVDSSPTVTAFAPANGTLVIVATTSIVVDFSEAMDASTITTGASTIVVAGTQGTITPSSVTYSAALRRATFNFAAPIPDDAYTVTVKGTGGSPIRDFAGNALDGDNDGAAGGDFTSGFVVDLDVTPTVTATNPSTPPNVTTPVTVVTVDFSEAMNGSRFNETTVQVVSNTDPNVIFNTLPGSVTYNASARRASITPDSPLGTGTYRIVVLATAAGTDIVDQNGNLLDGDNDGTAGGNFIRTFTVVISGSTMRVKAVDPAVNQRLTTGNLPGSPNRVRVDTNNEDVDLTSLTTNTYKVTDTAGVAITCTYAVSNNSCAGANCNARCEHAAALADDRYTVLVKSDPNNASLRVVSDVDPNRFLDGEFSGTFPSGDGIRGGDFTYDFFVDVDARPQVTAMVPAPASTVTTSTTTVSITFDQRMDPATITASTFTVVGAGSGVVTPDSVTFDAATETAVFTVAAGLGDDTYTVTLNSDGSGVDVSDFRDGSTGNHLDGDFGGTFPSGNGSVGGNFVATFTVNVAARVAAMTPAPGSSSMSLTAIVWTFDQTMDATTLTAGNVSIVGATAGAQTCDTLVASAGNTVLTCTKAAGFPEDTAYTLTLTSGGMKDADGANLDGEFSGTFPSGNGSAGGNFVATFGINAIPKVTAMTPSPGAEDNTPPSTVVATFSEGMDATTITTGTFTVAGVAGAVTPTGVTTNGGVTQATFTKATAFPDDRYTVTLTSGGMKDNEGTNLDGEFSGTFPSGNGTAGGNFTASFTVDADALPQVTAMSPSPGSTVTSAPTSVTVTFDQVMDASSITASSFTVSGSVVGAVTADSITFSPATRVATFAFAAGLPDDDYTVTLTAATIHDFGVPSGNMLDGEAGGGLPSGDGTAGGNFVVTFTVDATIPVVTAMSPSPGSSTGVSTISITFNEQIDPATVTSANFTVVGNTLGAQTPMSVTYDAPTRTATWTATAPLASDTYTVTLDATGSGLKDLAGNRLDGEFSGPFPSGNGTVGGDFVATITSTAASRNPGAVSSAAPAQAGGAADVTMASAPRVRRPEGSL